MSDVVISVENLSKRYLVGHRGGERERYVALRDVIAREARNFTRKAVDAFHGRQIVQGDEVEEFWALKDVSFNVQRGEVIGIIGKNGAGKSTVLKILSRITEPTAGRVRVRGRVASLLEVGTGFHPELTGRENIFLNGAILGMTQQEIRRKFDEIVTFAEVEQFLDTPVKHYSSGMYVRLAFAVAAHLEPEILIVDEVLAVGDIEFQRKCLGKMEHVVKEGRTVLFVSHQIAAISQLCRKTVWLDRGRVIEYGETPSVVSNYLGMGFQNTATVRFEAQVNDNGLFFKELSILDHKQKPSVQLDAKFPFHIRLFYLVREHLKEVEMAIRVKTNEGASVFTSVYSDYSDTSKMEKLAGSYAATVKLPALFLMPGTYNISVYAYRFLGGRVEPLHLLEDVLRFEICETGTKMAKYGNYHKDIGVVLVNFPWADEASDESRIISSDVPKRMVGS
jgi:lipopolysaccharide transport system ATP-binding protein